MQAMSRACGLRVANVFHAGDGNLHPLILYDANKPGELEAAEAFGADILRLCVAVGGVLTGEHGVGVEKRDLMGEMFNETEGADREAWREELNSAEARVDDFVNPAAFASNCFVARIQNEESSVPNATITAASSERSTASDRALP